MFYVEFNSRGTRHWILRDSEFNRFDKLDDAIADVKERSAHNDLNYQIVEVRTVWILDRDKDKEMRNE